MAKKMKKIDTNIIELHTPQNVLDCLQMIQGISIGYDGYERAEDLQNLIDELSELALKATEYLIDGKLDKYTELVRCKDCMWYYKNCEDSKTLCCAKDTWFCGDGKKVGKENV